MDTASIIMFTLSVPVGILLGVFVGAFFAYQFAVNKITFLIAHAETEAAGWVASLVKKAAVKAVATYKEKVDVLPESQ